MTIDLRVESQGLSERIELVGAAIEGSAEAQYELAELCRTGDGWAKLDLVEALNWYTLAARQGHARAQNNLGAMYHNGVGVPVDTVEAARWYRRAADQGFAMAQFNLALLLGWGVGVPMDEPEATRLLHTAAAQGHIEACSLLGTLYRFGDGVEKRIPVAAEFHVIAALAGDLNAMGNLADYATEIEDEALSGKMLAALCLAKMYDRGLGVEKNTITMYTWLLWGHKYGDRAADHDVAEELDGMREFYAMVIPEADKKAAAKLVKHLRTASSPTINTKTNRNSAKLARLK